MARGTMKKEWRQWWNSVPQKGREYFGHLRSKPDKNFQTDNRTLISTVTRLRTGHGYFNSYLSKIPTSNAEDTGRITTTDASTPHPKMPATCQNTDGDATGDTQNPQATPRSLTLHQHGNRSARHIPEDDQGCNQTVETWHRQQTSEPRQ
jgi:hypothetical protein